MDGPSGISVWSNSSKDSSGQLKGVIAPVSGSFRALTPSHTGNPVSFAALKASRARS